MAKKVAAKAAKKAAKAPRQSATTTTTTATKRSKKQKEQAQEEHEEAYEEESGSDMEEDEETTAAAAPHRGGMRGLMMRGGTEGGGGASSSSDSGGDDDDDEEEHEEEGGKGRPSGGKKRLLSSAAARASSNKKGPAQAVAASTGTGGAHTVKYDGSYKNRQRVLVFCSRGVTARYRHLLEDMRKLIPHHKKDVKLDCKGDLQVINEIAEVKSCNNCLFLEARKRQDLYLWLSKTPLGPSVKFNVLNVHTMDELRLTGNAMLGSRPLLSFDAAFEEQPHTRLLKDLLTDAFGTPRGHPKSKPFVDRVLSFALADGKVWVRNYQIVDTAPPPTADPVVAQKVEAKAARKGQEELTSLVEIGPRFVLNPIRIFAGSFGGPTLYQNPQFVSPNFVRAEKKRAEGTRLAHKMKADEVRKERKAKAVLPRDELQEIFRQKV